ncbi:oxygenase MpaB family protein [Nocardia thailandica]|uniref:oxygenase MpaB family protein n=1 Tax=Nocardia thailandica TaxID=257275 RepID=UPI0002F7CDDD|nr:oxygenase MpaB family protein [Nocardia thailandica]
MTAATIPTRHPARPRTAPGVIRLFARLYGVRGPSPDDWRELGEQLMAGDEPMDRLLEWMAATGLRETRPLFDRALAEGIDRVPDAPEPLREFFARVEATPGWVDWELIDRGARAMRMAGADGMFLARDVSLLGGYMFSGFNKTLLRTGALEKGSNQRFAETMQWAMDAISPGGMRPGALGYRSTLRVRLIHSFVRRHVSALPDWRGEDWGVPVNQTDMAATIVGSFIAPTAGGLGMGILPRPADAEAIAHFTRYVGWLLGVREEFLPVDFRDAIRLLAHTLAALSNPDESSKQLAVPMIDDPIAWNYRRFPALRRRLARSQHLSITSTFLGPLAMRSLGLPMFVPPWYPLLRFPINATRSVAAWTLPGGRDRAAARGTREIDALMELMTGGHGAEIGHSAHHVHPAA